MKWEYTVESISPYDIGAVNTLGQQGWELIAIHQSFHYFKRPLVEVKQLESKKGAKK